MTTTRRVLVYFSYLGTNYRGLQLQTTRRAYPDSLTIIPEYDTVQGIVEQALRKVLRYNDVCVHNSSRTDVGVHALQTTTHFEISDEAFQTIPFNPEKLCQSLNFYLHKNETEIRVERVVEVPNDFHCRRAHSRTYWYRIAVAKSNWFHNCLSVQDLSAGLPLQELNKAQVVLQPFNPEEVQQACRVLLGRWNFRSFASLPTKGREVPSLEDLTKTIYKFSFSKTKIDNAEDTQVDTGQGGHSSTYYTQDSKYGKLDFYDFHVEASGFLRRQVRRMVGILLSVGSGSISPTIILNLLQNPKHDCWPRGVHAAYADGLFLKSVNYKNVEVLRGYLS